jgi:hypothetical protein
MMPRDPIPRVTPAAIVADLFAAAERIVARSARIGIPA